MSNSRSRYLSMDRNYRSSLPAVLIWKLKSCLRFSDSNTVITSIDDTGPIISLHRNISCFIHLVDSWILSNSRCQVTVDRNWIYHPSLPAGLSLIYIFNLRRKHRHYSKMNDTIFSHYRFFFFWLRKYVGVGISSNSRYQITVDGNQNYHPQFFLFFTPI